jgi:hypothetical protein
MASSSAVLHLQQLYPAAQSDHTHSPAEPRRSRLGVVPSERRAGPLTATLREASALCAREWPLAPEDDLSDRRHQANVDAIALGA